MTLYKEWINFVTFPLDVERVKSEKERLDTSKAIYMNSDEYKSNSGEENGFVITLTEIIPTWDDDKFEAMEINSGGGVMIWTRKRVWILHTREGRGEKLMYLSRHPEFSNC